MPLNLSRTQLARLERNLGGQEAAEEVAEEKPRPPRARIKATLP